MGQGCFASEPVVDLKGSQVEVVQVVVDEYPRDVGAGTQVFAVVDAGAQTDGPVVDEDVGMAGLWRRAPGTGS